MSWWNPLTWFDDDDDEYCCGECGKDLYGTDDVGYDDEGHLLCCDCTAEVFEGYEDQIKGGSR